jgi:hypothetical protein
MATDVERVLAGALAEHWSYEPAPDYDGWLCECGATILRGNEGDLDAEMQAHVAAEQVKVLREWAQQDETVERIAYATSGCTSWANWHAVDEDVQREERAQARAVLTAIFGSSA